MIRSSDKKLVNYEFSTLVKIESFSTRVYEYHTGNFARIFHTPILVRIGDTDWHRSYVAGEDGLITALFSLGELQ